MSLLKPILLVEDSAADIELTLAALEDSHVANRVIVLRDGSEALNYLNQHYRGTDEDFPAVMLLDIKMPKVSGIEVLRSIKKSEQLHHVPVVMLTSSREGPDLNECYDLGANGYVVKPVEFSEFFEAVKALGKYWAVINEPPAQSNPRRKEEEVATGHGD
ncbi:MAG TPA: response regulator [Acidobacteriaceae bacterium]|nr:response regulator [Acidobacteriaceae bacterium]